MHAFPSFCLNGLRPLGCSGSRHRVSWGWIRVQAPHLPWSLVKSHFPLVSWRKLSGHRENAGKRPQSYWDQCDFVTVASGRGCDILVSPHLHLEERGSVQPTGPRWGWGPLQSDTFRLWTTVLFSWKPFGFSSSKGALRDAFVLTQECCPQFPRECEQSPSISWSEGRPPEVKPGTGSLIFSGTIMHLSAALLLWGLWASTVWAHSLLQEMGEHDSDKTQNVPLLVSLPAASRTGGRKMGLVLGTYEGGYWAWTLRLIEWALVPAGSWIFYFLACVCWAPTMCRALSYGFRKEQSWLLVAEPITFPSLLLPFWSSIPHMRRSLDYGASKKSLLGKDCLSDKKRNGKRGCPPSFWCDCIRMGAWQPSCHLEGTRQALRMAEWKGGRQ